MQFNKKLTTMLALVTLGLFDIFMAVNLSFVTGAIIPSTTAHLNTIDDALDTTKPFVHDPRDASGTLIHWYIFPNDTINFEYCSPWPNTITFSNDTCKPTVDDCYALREWYYQPLIETEYMYLTNFWSSAAQAPAQTWVTVHAVNTCQLQMRLGGNDSSAFISAIDIATRVNQSIYSVQFDGQEMLTSSGQMACSKSDYDSTGDVAVDWWMGCTNSSAYA